MDAFLTLTCVLILYVLAGVLLAAGGKTERRTDQELYTVVLLWAAVPLVPKLPLLSGKPIWLRDCLVQFVRHLSEE